MLKELKPSLLLLLVMTVLTGLAYPLAVTGLAQGLFPYQAGGSLIERGGKVVGSALLGQGFAGPGYFHPRDSATTDTDPADSTKTIAAPYNAANSGASNYGPTSKKFIDEVAARVEALKKDNPATQGPVPVDLATTSASGLDPHITPAGAEYQIERVAAARGMTVRDLRTLVGEFTEGRGLGFLGEMRVNVLLLNLALDERHPMKR